MNPEPDSPDAPSDDRSDLPSDASSDGPTDPHTRHLQAGVVQEIRTAAEAARSSTELYRRALARITPLVNADFASVFVRDEEDPALLKLACAQNWPQSSARYIGELRIREGRGPTGLALEQRRAVEVSDVFDDPALEEWWEPARELGFVSMIALPLESGETVRGVLSFYFQRREPLAARARSVLSAAAREMARAAGELEAGEG